MHFVDAVDVNVTPDKRQLFLLQEKMLLSIVKATLIRMFEGMVGEYDLNQSQAVAMEKVTLSKISVLSTQKVENSLTQPAHTSTNKLVSSKMSDNEAVKYTGSFKLKR